ncbi:hypothetical protein BaRGS_00000574 [Batillaria attramentaria]|uniref:Cysteine protease n=1 Tax=Batillaria attramentaria TaxID=370345 RepID=A0ABD0MA65_9CAEN
MSTAGIRRRSHTSAERSESLSDDVLSLDSWSEKLDPSGEWPADFLPDYSESHRLRVSSVGERTGVRHHSATRRPHSEVRLENVVSLRSEAPRNRSESNRFDAIPTVSGSVHSQGWVSSASPGTVGPELGASHAPTQAQPDQWDSWDYPAPPQPLSPSRKIPPRGSHHFFASYLRPHYQPSQPHLSYGHKHSHKQGHGFRIGHSPASGHFAHSDMETFQFRNPPGVGGGGAQHRGLPYHASPHHNHHGHGAVYTNGRQAPMEQMIEREGEKIKTKMKSMWNNVKYGWTIKTKTHFKYDSPIFLLGRCYHRRAEVSALDEFHADFTSRLWFTYRREFSPIGSAKMTTDCGWGCMLRSGQMMIAQALVAHFLRRDWRVYSEQRPEDLAFYREIIRWFGDYPSDKMPFSLHRLVELGTSVGKMPGDWYGPASVAHIFRDALEKAHKSLPILSDISVYVAQDCTIYLQDLISIASSHPRTDSQLSSTSSDLDSRPSTSSSQPRPDSSQEEKWRAMIILIPMRLGGESLNQIYVPCVKSMLAHDSCIGIIGGRPKHSLYFVGWQDDKLIYLDPHYCQDTVDTTQPTYPIQVASLIRNYTGDHTATKQPTTWL